MRTTRHAALSGFLAVALLAAGCATKHTYELPPRVDLRGYSVVGLVEFTSNTDPGLARLTSASMVEAIQYWQPGVRVLELGPERELLASLGQPDLGFQAIRAIGDRFGVEAVLTGRIVQGEVTPQLDIARSLRHASVGTNVDASLVTRLLETASGATAWTASGSAAASLTRASLGPNRAVFDPGNRDAARQALVSSLIDQVTQDFRPRYERR